MGLLKVGLLSRFPSQFLLQIYRCLGFAKKYEALAFSRPGVPCRFFDSAVKLGTGATLFAYFPPSGFPTTTLQIWLSDPDAKAERVMVALQVKPVPDLDISIV